MEFDPDGLNWKDRNQLLTLMSFVRWSGGHGSSLVGATVSTRRGRLDGTLVIAQSRRDRRGRGLRKHVQQTLLGFLGGFRTIRHGVRGVEAECC